MFGQLLWHMYGFPLAISCCVKISKIPSKFVKYTDVPLFKAFTLVVYGAAIHWLKIPIKEIRPSAGSFLLRGQYFSK